MKSFRTHLPMILIMSLPAAALELSACSRSPAPSSCINAPSIQGPVYTVDGGCGSCDPVADLCSNETDGSCQRVCHYCGCSTNQIALASAEGKKPGVKLEALWCTQHCGGPPAPGAKFGQCHLEYDANGSPVPGPDGGVMLACTWAPAEYKCGPDSQPCLACDPVMNLCDLNEGGCVDFLGNVNTCGLVITTVLVDESLDLSNSGGFNATNCKSLCIPPDPSLIPGEYPDGCHIEMAANGMPISCEGSAILVCGWNSEVLCEAGDAGP